MDKGALGTPAWLLPGAALEASSTYTSLMGVGGAVLVWVLGGDESVPGSCLPSLLCAVAVVATRHSQGFLAPLGE